MRNLCLVELEMIVGGYSQFDAGDYSGVATDNGDGSYSLVVSEAEYSAQASAAADNGWGVEVTGGWTQNGGFSVGVKASKKC
ncbi:hypothetical protein [Sphingomonas sp. KR3-1]|uniref:hypothetical protein n=1 Tax=Sphingomonas sp. KR3-1 TaxID=3156611 RepID=UPI0032B48A12